MSPRVESDESYTKSLYPDDLLESFSRRQVQREWWVLCTKPREEKAVARELVGHQVPFYLPLVRMTSVHRGRSVSSFIPLFSGYVFLYGSEEERVLSLRTNRISRVIAVHDPDRLRHDLRQVRQLIAANVPLTVEGRLRPGDRVRVRYGPLAGLEGTVVTRRGQTRLVVSVDFLQQGASVEIDDLMLEPLVSSESHRVVEPIGVPQPQSLEQPLLDDLPTPPEVQHATEAYCRREGIRRKRDNLSVEQQFKLQFYYGGENVICVDTPKGRRIIAHGVPGSGKLRDTLEQLSPQERAKAVIIPVEPWAQDAISTSSTFLHDA